MSLATVYGMEMGKGSEMNAAKTPGKLSGIMCDARARAQYREYYYRWYKPTSDAFFHGDKDKAHKLRAAWPIYFTEFMIKNMFAALSEELDG